MEKKIKALGKNQTWKSVNLLKGKMIVGCKSMFTVKCKLDRSVHKYKACLVV